MGKTGLKVAHALAALLALAACAAPPAAPLPPLPPGPLAPVSPPIIGPPPAPPAPAAKSLVNQCGASELQYLVGRPKSEIPVPVNPNSRRVLCAGCPMTQDYSPTRQTILYAADTGLVTSVACG